MGLARGLVRRVFKRPCSASALRSHGSGGSEGKHRWSPVKIFVCGDDPNCAGEEEGATSAQSSEVAVMLPPAANEVSAGGSGDDGERREITSVMDKPEDANEEMHRVEAATLIQAAFRGFRERRQIMEMKNRSASPDFTEEPSSPMNSASVEVQVAESLSNLTMSEESVMLQQRLNHKVRATASRVKEDWDDSTKSCTELKMKIQHRLEAMNRRERAMAYAFSQQLRICNHKKRSALHDQGDLNVGWTWLERWMATRQPENPPVDDCISMNQVDESPNRRFIIIKKRLDTSAVEEKESCGSNEVSISFEGCKSSQHLRCGYQAVKSRLKATATRGSPRRKTVQEHRSQSGSNKISKKGHHNEKEDEDGCNRQERLLVQLDNEEYDDYHLEEQNYTALVSPA